MVVPGTQMHLVTFLFICIEIAIFSYLFIYHLARPDDRKSSLNLILLFLLIVYNLTGGLFPDPHLPGSFFLQECIAYGTGFITPCYFPYFVYRGFGFEKMRFHAYRGVWYCLIAPYLLFVALFAISGRLEVAQNILILPVLYALWVLYSLFGSIRFKYQGDFSGREAREEAIVLFLSITPWLGLPFITYFDLSQMIEASVTNTGFLLLLALHVKRNIEQLKEEHQRLIASEEQLLSWNERLQQEVDKRTRELEKIKLEERMSENFKRYRLTSREKEIVSLICAGSSYKQIAETLYISERTVTKHVQNIFDKVQVSNKLELFNKVGATLAI